MKVVKWCGSCKVEYSYTKATKTNKKESKNA